MNKIHQKADLQILILFHKESYSKPRISEATNASTTVNKHKNVLDNFSVFSVITLSSLIKDHLS